MPARLSWSQLLPGLVAFAAVILAALGVVRYAGVGRVRGEKMHIYVRTEQARGVMRGTDVWVAGQKIGLVEDIQFRPPSNDSLGRVIIALSVRKRDAVQIRRDSRPQIRAGASFIAPIVVYISAGSADSPPVKSGDTLSSGKASDMEVATVKMAAATAEIAPIMADARTIIGRVHDRRGTVGAIMTEGLGGDVGSLRAQVSRMRAKVAARTTTPGGPALTTRAKSAMARVDSVRTLLASPRSAFGRFRRDSTLMRTVGSLRDELTELRTAMANEEGTIGRFKTDSALAKSIENARTEMSVLFADIKRRPMQYVQF